MFTSFIYAAGLLFAAGFLVAWLLMRRDYIKGHARGVAAGVQRANQANERQLDELLTRYYSDKIVNLDTASEARR